MRVGLISDTHDNTDRTERALSILEQQEASVLVHAGDLVSGELVPLFDGWRVWLARGNVDRPRSIREAIEAHQADIAYDVKHEVQAGKATIGVIHGDDAGRLEGMINSGAFELVVHGHSHTFRDERIGATRVVNPGAVHRAKTPSVCVWDVEEDALERLEIPA